MPTKQLNSDYNYEENNLEYNLPCNPCAKSINGAVCLASAVVKSLLASQAFKVSSRDSESNRCARYGPRAFNRTAALIIDRA